MLLPSFSAMLALFLMRALYAQEPAFVGSRACAECHRETYENYARTGMGRSMQPAANLSLPAPAERDQPGGLRRIRVGPAQPERAKTDWLRSEEHTSELQSRGQLVCRLLLLKKS